MNFEKSFPLKRKRYSHISTHLPCQMKETSPFLCNSRGHNHLYWLFPCLSKFDYKFIHYKFVHTLLAWHQLQISLYTSIVLVILLFF